MEAMGLLQQNWEVMVALPHRFNTYQYIHVSCCLSEELMCWFQALIAYHLARKQTSVSRVAMYGWDDLRK